MNGYARDGVEGLLCVHVCWGRGMYFIYIFFSNLSYFASFYLSAIRYILLSDRVHRKQLYTLHKETSLS